MGCRGCQDGEDGVDSDMSGSDMKKARSENRSEVRSQIAEGKSSKVFNLCNLTSNLCNCRSERDSHRKKP